MGSADTGRLDQLREAHKHATMVGWDFSRLDGTMTSETPPWDFERDCLEAMLDAKSVLDVGTGGGERLLSLVEQVKAKGKMLQRIEATEGWEPNVEVAKRALEPHGIHVHQYDPAPGQQLPCQDDAFDLVMNRHETLDAVETARILKPGGRFLTQQVHGLEVPEFQDWFGSKPQYPHVTAENFCSDLKEAGLEITTVEDWSGRMTFKDAEALVTYLGLVPWDVPEDFTVDAHADRLLGLDSAPISVTQRRFRVYAGKD